MGFEASNNRCVLLFFLNSGHCGATNLCRRVISGIRFSGDGHNQPISGVVGVAAGMTINNSLRDLVGLWCENGGSLRLVRDPMVKIVHHGWLMVTIICYRGSFEWLVMASG